MNNFQTFSKEEVTEATLDYFAGDELATNVWVTKYALRDLEDNYYELTPSDMHHRLATEFARIEQKYPNPKTNVMKIAQSPKACGAHCEKFR